MPHKENIDYYVSISSPVNMAVVGSNIFKLVCGRTGNFDLSKENASNSKRSQQESRFAVFSL